MINAVKWEKFASFLVILLIGACSRFNRGVSPSDAIPTLTKTVDAVASSTSTPVPFKPGDPTATPQGSDITDPNYIKGVEAIYADKYEEALVLLNTAIEANPNLAPPYQYRGLVYYYFGDCASGLQMKKKRYPSIPIMPLHGHGGGCYIPVLEMIPRHIKIIKRPFPSTRVLLLFTII